jgi:hypothetical protein
LTFSIQFQLLTNSFWWHWCWWWWWHLWFCLSIFLYHCWCFKWKWLSRNMYKGQCVTSVWEQIGRCCLSHNWSWTKILFHCLRAYRFIFIRMSLLFYINFYTILCLGNQCWCKWLKRLRTTITNPQLPVLVKYVNHLQLQFFEKELTLTWFITSWNRYFFVKSHLFSASSVKWRYDKVVFMLFCKTNLKKTITKIQEIFIFELEKYNHKNSS